MENHDTVYTKTLANFDSKLEELLPPILTATDEMDFFTSEGINLFEGTEEHLTLQTTVDINLEHIEASNSTDNKMGSHNFDQLFGSETISGDDGIMENGNVFPGFSQCESVKAGDTLDRESKIQDLKDENDRIRKTMEETRNTAQVLLMKLESTENDKKKLETELSDINAFFLLWGEKIILDHLSYGLDSPTTKTDEETPYDFFVRSFMGLIKMSDIPNCIEKMIFQKKNAAVKRAKRSDILTRTKREEQKRNSKKRIIYATRTQSRKLVAETSIKESSYSDASSADSNPTDHKNEPTSSL